MERIIAEVKRRTYHSWTRLGVRPRLGSQGDLWSVFEFCRELEEVLGEVVADWFKSSREHRAALRERKFDSLLAAAYTSRLPRTVQEVATPSSVVGPEPEIEHLSATRVPKRGARTRVRTPRVLERDAGWL